MRKIKLFKNIHLFVPGRKNNFVGGHVVPYFRGCWPGGWGGSLTKNIALSHMELVRTNTKMSVRRYQIFGRLYHIPRDSDSLFYFFAFWATPW